MFGSSLWDGCGVLHEGNQLLSSSGLTPHQVQCWDHQRTQFGGLDGKNPGRSQQMVLLEGIPHKILESCIYLIWNLVQYPMDEVESSQGHPGIFLIREG